MRERTAISATRAVFVQNLRAGDCVELKTANSRYTFWVEYASVSIGVAYGGKLGSPTRVRLTPEGTASGDSAARALAPGDRAQLEVLGPDGRPVRKFLTSPLSEIVVRPGNSAAA